MIFVIRWNCWDEVENVLKIHCAPITWPIGCGKLFKGVYHLYKDEIYLYQTGQGHTIQEVRIVKGLNNPELDNAVGDDLAQQLRDELELVKGASNEFDLDLFLNGELTPVFFGTALGNFGVDHFLDGLTEWAPAPQARQADVRKVSADEEKFSGFVFKNSSQYGSETPRPCCVLTRRVRKIRKKA